MTVSGGVGQKTGGVDVARPGPTPPDSVCFLHRHALIG